MRLDQSVLSSLTADWTLRRLIRVTPMAHALSPLGMGYGRTRFASPDQTFKVLYLGSTLVTSVAETIVRDRFVHRARRLIMQEEIESWGATEVSTNMPLCLLDLRGMGPTLLGIPTDAVSARNQRSGRRLSADLYTQAPHLDGVIYSSRHVRKDCIAVFDRAVVKLGATRVVSIIELPALAEALLTLNITMIPRN